MAVKLHLGGFQRIRALPAGSADPFQSCHLHAAGQKGGGGGGGGAGGGGRGVSEV